MKSKSQDKTQLGQRHLQDIARYAKLIASWVAMRQVEKLVSTNERKAIWYLCSGNLTREQIAKKSGISLRTVTTFIDMLKTYGLVEEEKDKGGHAQRVIDYCPPEWKDFMKPKKIENTGQQNQSMSTI
jgi:Fic family protein